MKKFKVFMSIVLLFATFTFIGILSKNDIVKTAFADDYCYGGCVDCFMDIETQTYYCDGVEGGWCYCSEQGDPSEVCNLSIRKRCFPKN